MSVAANQQRNLLKLVAALRPHWRTDRNLPARIQSVLSRNRAFGSRDRRLYRELLYTTVRFLPWVEALLASDPPFAAAAIAWLSADLPATAAFRKEFCGEWPRCPISLKEKADLLSARALDSTSGSSVKFETSHLLPAWVENECPTLRSSPEIDVVHTRAPLWLRVRSRYEEEVAREFAEKSWRYERSPVLEGAWRILDDLDVTQSESYQKGFFEIQDLGSHLLLSSLNIARGEYWLDACAGAGGKTLQLADILGASGRIDATDVRKAALEELARRAARARVANIRVAHSEPGSQYDGILVDAPCTGSGTWRRAPHLKWTTTDADIRAAARLQLELLLQQSDHVRPGGRLVYATCSVNRSENEDVITRFLATRTHFESECPARQFGARFDGVGLNFPSSLHDSDGFFIASLRRRSENV